MANIEKMQAELQRLQEKEKIWKNRAERKKARIRSARRSKNDKERTHRLIQKGLVLEDIQATASGIQKLPKVPRVSKDEDPGAAARFQAYKKSVQEKNSFSKKTSPEDSQAWLETLVGFRDWANRFTFTDKQTGETEHLWERYIRLQNQNNQRS